MGVPQHPLAGHDLARFELGIKNADSDLMWPRRFLRRRPSLPVFVIGRPNRCPDCNGEAFAVGRITAECSGCGLPLALVEQRRSS